MGNMLVCLEPPNDAVVAGWDLERNQDTGPCCLILSLQHDIIVSVESPQPLFGPRISCCSPQVSCVSGASTRPAVMRFPFLVCVSPPPLGLLPVFLLLRLLTVIMKCLFFPTHAVLLCFVLW
jgi:hypothetical protein